MSTYKVNTYKVNTYKVNTYKVNTQLITVPFMDHCIAYIERDGEPYVPVKPICERLGVDWSSQRQKIKKRSELYGVVKITSPSAGGEQEMVCLPLVMVPMWLATIQANKVHPNLKDCILAYQKDCAAVLWQHWSGQTSQAVAELKAELNQEQLYRENLQAHLMAGKPAWTRIMHMASLHWTGSDLAQLIGWSQDKMACHIAAMEECGLLQEREDKQGCRRLYIRKYSPAYVPEARLLEG